MNSSSHAVEYIEACHPWYWWHQHSGLRVFLLQLLVQRLELGQLAEHQELLQTKREVCGAYLRLNPEYIGSHGAFPYLLHTRHIHQDISSIRGHRVLHLPPAHGDEGGPQLLCLAVPGAGEPDPTGPAVDELVVAGVADKVPLLTPVHRGRARHQHAGGAGQGQGQALGLGHVAQNLKHGVQDIISRGDMAVATLRYEL